MEPSSVITLLVSNWEALFQYADSVQAIDSLERGLVLFFKDLAFSLTPAERRFLTTGLTDQKAKNISYDPSAGELRGMQIAETDKRDLASMMHRFATQARDFAIRLLPAYKGGLRLGRTSYRPIEVLGRKTSNKKDDSRLHIDAFASNPVQGQRILRLFSNINPFGKPRVWLLGEPFERFAPRFLPSVPAQWPLSAWLLQKIRVTKSRRTAYDHVMLNLHDRAKLDAQYQRSAPQERIEFPAGSTWMLFSDRVPHAALAGQFALEQTFYLPVESMASKERSPLRILEAYCGRRLV